MCSLLCNKLQLKARKCLFWPEASQQGEHFDAKWTKIVAGNLRVKCWDVTGPSKCRPPGHGTCQRLKFPPPSPDQANQITLSHLLQILIFQHRKVKKDDPAEISAAMWHHVVFRDKSSLSTNCHGEIVCGVPPSITPHHSAQKVPPARSREWAVSPFLPPRFCNAIFSLTLFHLPF